MTLFIDMSPYIKQILLTISTTQWGAGAIGSASDSSTIQVAKNLKVIRSSRVCLIVLFVLL